MQKSAGKILNFPQQKRFGVCSSPSLPARLRSIFPDLGFIVYPKGLHLYFQSRIGAILPYIMAMSVLCGGTLSDMLLKKKENPERWQ